LSKEVVGHENFAPNLISKFHCQRCHEDAQGRSCPCLSS
jgi:hypothetical protein